MNLLSRIIVLVIFALWLVGIFYLSSLGWPERGWSKQKSPPDESFPFQPPVSGNKYRKVVEVKMNRTVHPAFWACNPEKNPGG